MSCELLSFRLVRYLALSALMVTLFQGCGGEPLKQATSENETESGSQGADAPTAKAGSETAKPKAPAGSAPPADKSAASSSGAMLTEQELADGWISLFDGETLFGWRPHSKANWRVEDGAIVVDTGDVGLLCTDVQFSDYVLKVDFRAAKGTNSGVFLRTPTVVVRDDVETKCYELNIAPPDNPFPTGSLVGRKKVAGDHSSAGWQTYEITLKGPSVTIKLDDKVIVEYAENPVPRGLIGLQINQGRVEFRNIKLKPLGLQSMFNGKDLAGWKPYPDMATNFSATDTGELLAKNTREGRGQLETEKSYGDFILQLECMTHAPNLNSGIFFRCIPGDIMMGYESQIHFGFIDGDRNKPKDHGTGGIFRRQPARRVVGEDRKWVHKTIVATGPSFAVWVNGYQVSNWTDTRPPHQNPRKGQRLQPGSIILQGHDLTTHLSFRKLRIAELAR